ncbi:class I fructose-bisphosphate aldolase [Thiolapillus brandeum]|uniref:Probable fructose-bisphosphate aldolase class 1 n=1 Tax=Thiolapillus brandeum TaxID=1076588 RepID=A0A7U6JHP8_9GAMM|nr:class I fructose-bisphosphate aldolase [Thiolapillus brandeum]BAO44694.1 fructose-bisphosphate aldolase class I [Thiolapillus brandeum]
MSTNSELQQTISDMVDDHRGILAADESLPTITKRFAAIDVEASEENRRAYRALLLDTPDLGKYISGVILFEETLGQQDDSRTPLPKVAWSQKIVPGVKVDKGKGPLPGAPGDLITYGLDGLGERLEHYKQQGARFAKWREVYPISRHNPTRMGRHANAEMLARYAAVCQEKGVVPIVEPEVLMDGDHDIDRCASVTEHVLHSVFHALHLHGVSLEHMILKPNMVLPGKDCRRADPEEVAEATLRILKRTVPAAVPSINFLSGGQGPEEATANLNAINQLKGNAPWQLSISYGRALQQPALHAWLGKAENREKAQQALLKRARLNSLARQGKYDPSMENSDA